MKQLCKSLTVAAIVAGFAFVSTARADEPNKAAPPAKAEPKKAEPKKAEPKKVEPKKVEPKKVEPKKVEPKKVEPTTSATSAPAAAADAKKKKEIANSACLDCHADKDNVNGKKQYVVDGKLFKKGPHTEDNGVTCAECHVKAKTVADVSDHGKLGKPSCAGCHDAQKHISGSVHGRAVNGKKLPTCASCHGPAHTVVPVADKASPSNRLNQPKTCGTCHTRESDVPTFMKSVHGERLRSGKKDGPSCSNCHSPHKIMPADIIRNVAFKVEITKRCSKCHGKVAKVYNASIHGQALLTQNVYGAPSCVDCHLSHEIEHVHDARSNVYKTKVVETCGHCHGDERLVRRFKLKPNVVGTYEASFHGRAGRLGDKKVAKCSSCHDHHAVFPAKDKRSSIHHDNLAKSCGKCHPGATEKFIAAKIHVAAGSRDNYWAWFVRNLYLWLIALVIGGMAAHNLVDWIRKNIIRARAQARDPHVIRMTKLERMLHIALASSFLLLCYTGFALLYPKAWWVTPLNWISNTEGFRSMAHRIAGVVLTVVALHHLWFLFFHRVGRIQRREFMPRLVDLRDLYHNILWLLGARKERPHFPRFSYIEKAEYWALVWGTAVMVITGFVLWFEEIALKFIPLSLWEVFQVVHRYEAILAFLAIIVWHFYYVFVNPDEAPMSLTWATGRMSLHELAIAHPAEYERLMAERRTGEFTDPEHALVGLADGEDPHHAAGHGAEAEAKAEKKAEKKAEEKVEKKTEEKVEKKTEEKVEKKDE